MKRDPFTISRTLPEMFFLCHSGSLSYCPTQQDSPLPTPSLPPLFPLMLAIQPTLSSTASVAAVPNFSARCSFANSSVFPNLARRARRFSCSVCALEAEGSEGSSMAAAPGFASELSVVAVWPVAVPCVDVATASFVAVVVAGSLSSDGTPPSALPAAGRSVPSVAVAVAPPVVEVAPSGALVLEDSCCCCCWCSRIRAMRSALTPLVGRLSSVRMALRSLTFFAVLFVGERVSEWMRAFVCGCG